ncbi:hypothetical protein CXG81DRAFT_20469 [Caulochytrium protostelioides]|uniref:Uncharacterized protein n=1 Tax=Caulochytrium protostelioides TaxID=1555241 RepID=A0A4P9X362_9FUNG|nr:hypothetical protein CXG81DRAFT_20469 [Caulochytrium protostelioides]|eukprot:RKO99453.1 hypothetical protein CXG81DRAFT_20469 [Caulochytrium protostelioides]
MAAPVLRTELAQWFRATQSYDGCPIHAKGPTIVIPNSVGGSGQRRPESVAIPRRQTSRANFSQTSSQHLHQALALLTQLLHRRGCVLDVAVPGSTAAVSRVNTRRPAQTLIATSKLLFNVASCYLHLITSHPHTRQRPSQVRAALAALDRAIAMDAYLAIAYLLRGWIRLYDPKPTLESSLRETLRDWNMVLRLMGDTRQDNPRATGYGQQSQPQPSRGPRARRADDDTDDDEGRDIDYGPLGIYTPQDGAPPSAKDAQHGFVLHKDLVRHLRHAAQRHVDAIQPDPDAIAMAYGAAADDDAVASFDPDVLLPPGFPHAAAADFRSLLFRPPPQKLSSMGEVNHLADASGDMREVRAVVSSPVGTTSDDGDDGDAPAGLLRSLSLSRSLTQNIKGGVMRATTKLRRAQTAAPFPPGPGSAGAAFGDRRHAGSPGPSPNPAGGCRSAGGSASRLPEEAVSAPAVPSRSAPNLAYLAPAPYNGERAPRQAVPFNARAATTAAGGGTGAAAGGGGLARHATYARYGR